MGVGVYRELCYSTYWCVHTCTTGGGGGILRTVLLVCSHLHYWGGYIANCVVGVFTLALPEGGGGYIANCVVGVFTLALLGGGILRTVLLVCSHLHYRKGGGISQTVLLVCSHLHYGGGGYIANCVVGVFTLALPGGGGILRTVLLVCSHLHYRGGGIYRELCCWCVLTCTTGRGGGGYIANCVGVFTLYRELCCRCVHTCTTGGGGGISRTVL